MLLQEVIRIVLKQMQQYYVDNDSRKKARTSSPDVYESYWTRSPNAQVSNWVYSINEQGDTYGYSYPGQEMGVLMMFSITCEG